VLTFPSTDFDALSEEEVQNGKRKAIGDQDAIVVKSYRQNKLLMQPKVNKIRFTPKQGMANSCSGSNSIGIF
jgi:hypothetical protein